MIKDITIGQYIYGTSVLHKMEAWVKIILTIVYAAAVCMLKSPVSHVIYILFTMLLIRLGAIPLRIMLKGLKPVLPIFLFTAFFDLFFTEGHELLRYYFICVTYEGLTDTIRIGIRLTLLITGCSLLTLTTPPLSLTDGIEKLMKPLKIFRVPVHDIAMMMSIALRFVPTIADEADRLIKAQKARGADMDGGNLIRRARSLVPVIIPLLTGAFRRADDLAVAMDARCYNGERRTRMKTTRAGRRDAAAVAVFAAVTAAAIAL